MRAFCSFVVVSIALAAAAVGQTTTSTADSAATPSAARTTTAKDSPLLAAAKKSGVRKMPRKVITNKDVKKSKGKLAVSTPKPLPEGAARPDADLRSPTQKSDALYVARRDAQARSVAAEKRVKELQRDVASIEQAYYAEKNLDLRDDVIQKRFAQAKRQLEAAQKELADARDAIAAANPKQ